MFNFKGTTQEENVTKLLVNILFATLLVTIIICGFTIYKDKKVNRKLQSIEIYGYKLDKPFKQDEYEYSVTVDKNYIKVLCDTTNNIIGCNQKIDLTDEEEYVHEIVVDPTGKNIIYLLYITKETKEDKEVTESETKTSLMIENETVSEDQNTDETNANDQVEDNKKDLSKTLKAVFHLNGADKINNSNKETIELTCKTTSNSCDITLPSITRSGYTILGWSTNKYATKGDTKPNITLTQSTVDYYAITSKTLTATFNANGATISSKSATCNIYNTQTECSVKTPKITRSGYEIQGWSKSKTTSDLVNPTNNVSINKNKTFYAMTKKQVDKKEKELKAVFHLNGADKINNFNKESIELTCKTTSNSCNITLPSIIRSGYIILGWSTNKDATKEDVKQNVILTLTQSSIDYYAITSKTLTATFNENGSTISKKTDSCTIYNTNKSCNIQTPTITRSGYNILGWGETKTINSNLTSPKNYIAVSNNKTYYAITSKKENITAYFYANGADSIGTQTLSCELKPNQNSCTVIAPTIKRTGNSIVFGWSTDSNSKNASYKAGDKITLIKNTSNKFYAITSKDITVTFDKNGHAAAFEYSSKSCTLYNNGNCSIKIPYIYVSGYHITGFNTTLSYSGKSPEYIINYSYDFNKDITLYADFTSEYTKRFGYIPLGYPMSAGKIQIDMDSNVSWDVIMLRKDFINLLYKKMPILFRNSGKIRIMSHKYYGSVWGSGSGGMTFGYDKFKLIDINDSGNLFSNQTIVHELAHKFDYQNGRISETQEWISLYNKYKNQNVLTTYSKNDPTEFFAEAVNIYYFKNYMTDSEYYEYIGKEYGEKYRKNAYYPSDIKTFIEKYLK